MLVKTYGGAIFGVDSTTITVEVNIGRGIGYHLVGLPDNAIKESSYRINTALTNNNFKWPGKKIIVNMAPADIRKEGSSYDLTIAIGILSASGQIDCDRVGKYLIMGELSLDGSILPIKGVLPIAIKAREDGFEGFILPMQNAKEAAIVDGLDVLGVNNISEVTKFFNNESQISPTKINTRELFRQNINSFELDFSDVKGQESVKRCMEISASGGHNIILIGPPGSGKTMLAKRIPTILPPMTLHEALETTKIHSVSGKLKNDFGLMTLRPFRSPHHTISDVALVGGGAYPQPGEISLSHNGVLFLDELPEFKRSVLEVMRQPLEDRDITISRAMFTVTYPASFMLIASMNPSPSGYFYDENSSLPQSTPLEIQRYLNKISGPLLDRIDIHIEVEAVKFEELSEKRKGETSQTIRKRVVKARDIQTERFEDSKTHYNAQMSKKEIEKYCKLEPESLNLLKIAMDKLNLSARAYDRILKVSRTVADLENSKDIKSHHIAETIQYRSLDRNNWMG